MRDAILLTIAEMGANAIRHGDPEPTEVGVRLLLEGASIVIEITDDGGPFSGFQRSLVNSRMKREHLFAESGRGLSIIESMLDELCYEPGPPNRFVGKRLMASAARPCWWWKTARCCWKPTPRCSPINTAS